MRYSKQIRPRSWLQVTIKDLLTSGKATLAEKLIGPVDAELILAHLLGVTRMELHSRPIEKSDEELEIISEQFHAAIAERISGIPTQYIVGEAAFRYLEYDVGPGVLIPRPETELLVDEVLHHMAALAEPISVVDLGAGTGAIAISIASESAGKKNVHVVAVEKSPEAAHWLNMNIARHDVNVRVVVEDVATALEGVKCDIVTANPPYVPNEQELPPELSAEPAIALFGGPNDGMFAPKQFIAAAARLLKPGGFFAIEHNEIQGPAIAEAMASDFETIALHSDLTDRPRFTTGVRKSY